MSVPLYTLTCFVEIIVFPHFLVCFQHTLLNINLLIFDKNSGNYPVTKPGFAEEAAWEDDAEDDASETTTQKAIDHDKTASADRVVIANPIQIKMRDFEVSKLRKTAGCQKKLAGPKTMRASKKKMASTLNHAEVKETEMKAAVKQSKCKDPSNGNSQCDESFDAQAPCKVDTGMETLESSTQDTRADKTAGPAETLGEQSPYAFAVETTSGTDNFTQVFGDRAQPTPPKPFPRGSFGYCAVGVFYIYFMFEKWMLWK